MSLDPLTADDICPACSFDAGTTYEAENGQFRIWCTLCCHSTAQYQDLDLARLEWLGGRGTSPS